MAPAVDTQGPEPTYVVWRIEAKANGLFAVHVQMPDGTGAIILVPGVGLSITNVRLSAFVVAQLWETKRGATPLAEGSPPGPG